MLRNGLVFLFIAFNFIKSASKILPTLKILVNNFKIEEYLITLESNYTEIYGGYRYFGKLILLKEYLKIENLNKLSQYFNSKWIFLIEDKNEALKFLEDMNNNLTQYSNSPLIIPNFLRTEIPSNTSKGYIFSASEKLFLHLKEFDETRVNQNIFISLSINYQPLIIPFTTLKIVVIITVLISAVLISIWKQKFKREIRHNFVLSRLVVFFPLFKILIGTLLLYKIRYIQIRKVYEIYNGKDYIHFLLLTTNLVYRTLLWFFGIFVASGWEITYNIIERVQLKQFFQKYILIYFALCVDEGIDNIFKGEITRFSPSEIKNIILYFLLLMIIFYQGKKTYRELRRQLFLAQFGYNEYVESLNIKLKMITWHLRINLLFYICYVSLVLIMSSIYTTIEIKEFIYHLADLIFVIGYVLLYLPKNLPELFSSFLNNNISYFSNVYQVTIRSKISYYIKDLANIKAPIIIVNPGYFTSSLQKSSFGVMNFLKIGAVNIEKNEIILGNKNIMKLTHT